MNIQDWFPSWLSGLISLQTPLKGLLQQHGSKASILWCSTLWSNSHIHTWLLEKPTKWTFVSKVIALLFNMLSRLVTAFLLRTKRLLISWLKSPSAVILEPKKIKSVTVSIVSLFAMKWWHLHTHYISSILKNSFGDWLLWHIEYKHLYLLPLNPWNKFITAQESKKVTIIRWSEILSQR